MGCRGDGGVAKGGMQNGGIYNSVSIKNKNKECLGQRQPLREKIADPVAAREASFLAFLVSEAVPDPGTCPHCPPKAQALAHFPRGTDRKQKEVCVRWGMMVNARKLGVGNGGWW